MKINVIAGISLTILICTSGCNDKGNSNNNLIMLLLGQQNKPWQSTDEFTAKLTASDGAALDHFGCRAAISGDGSTIVVGAIDDDSSQGSAYVFTQSGGTWIQAAKLTASDGVAGDKFGWDVSISYDGNTIVVGAPENNSARGGAYVFMKSGEWTIGTETAKFTASDGAVGDMFGASVSMADDGNTVVVGAFEDDSARGGAYVFVKSGVWTTGTETAKLTASDGDSKDGFGECVDISGDGSIVVVGARGNTIRSNAFQGSVYVFVKSGSWSTGTETAILVASDGEAEEEFGSSVAISSDGNTIVVGDWGDDVNGNERQGSAYVFMKGAGWINGNETAKLTASDGAASDLFGIHVSVSGDGSTVIVGAIFDDIGASSNQGSAYIFVRPGGVWSTATETAKLAALDGATGALFGSVSLTSDGSTVVVGACGDTIGSNDGQGSAYVYMK